MKAETKSAAILVATLALGVVLGMVTQGLLMRQLGERAGGLRRPGGFVSHLEGVIEPTAAQRDTVHALLERTAARNQTVIEGARGELRALLDSLQLQLSPILDEGQRDRLARMSRLPDPFRPPPRDGRPPREGPPPEGPPREGPPPDGGPPPRP